MPPPVPPGTDLRRLKLHYEWAEQRYMKSLPLEYFTESISQSTQRKITLESFDLISVARPDVQCFNELLVQYPRPGQNPDKPGQVVPDNMVVVHSEPIEADGSYMTPLQPAGPLLVLEYVSKSSVRKDYEVNYEKYEKELGVPYYLLFYPDADELSLFRLNDKGYSAVLPNAAGRRAVPELEIEVALLGGWVRYWFRGELLPLPGDLLRQLNATRDELSATATELTTTKAELTVTKSELDAERQARAALEAELARFRAAAKPAHD